MRIRTRTGMALIALLTTAFLSASAGAVVIPGGNYAGDFTLITGEDVSQSGVLTVSGTTTVGGANIDLSYVDPTFPAPPVTENDFSYSAANLFSATGALIINEDDGFRGAFYAGNGLDITSGGSIIIDAMDVQAYNAVVAALDGTNYFDILIKNAQNLHVAGTLFLTGEDILFEFSDGLAPSLDRLDVGELIYSTVSDGTADTTVTGPGLVLANGAPTSPPPPITRVPEPVSIALFALGLVGLGFMRRRGQPA